MRFYGLLYFMLASLPLLFAQQKQNPYGLPMVSSWSDYMQEVDQNPNNQLIDISRLITGIRISMPYADTNNFTRKRIYSHERALLRKPVALALAKAQKVFDSLGFALLIYDAYRPYEASLKFYEIYPDTLFVAAPWKGSRHNRGAAVDVGLIDKNSGLLVPMPTNFDDFSEKASPFYKDLPPEIIRNRELLIQTMNRFGFEVYPSEWWHFDFRGWQNFSLLNLSFDELKNLE